MKKLLILGEHGMLGDAVRKYFDTLPAYELVSITGRWPEEAFKGSVRTSGADVIINCIGKIPQRHPTDHDYRETNIELPEFLDTVGIRVVHPSTDCEFKGTLPVGSLYTKDSVRDADDVYGMSKAEISEKIEKEFSNTKILRTSIIGHELNSSVSLLDWFLSSEGTVRGYTNHYWNGITTLMWAQLAHDLIENWDSYPVLNQHGTKDTKSKHDVLHVMRDVYGTQTEIVPFESPETVNKCLLPDIEIPNLKEQLKELKAFYQR